MNTVEDHMEGYRRKQQTIVDRVRGILTRHHNGLYVFGATGIGKTWSIEGTLEEAQQAGRRSYRKLEGRCTPPGLIELVRDYPDHILFIDDDPQLAKDRLAQQLLLHMCGDGKVETLTRERTFVL
jgi:hypothetical protein